jgi:hypothetical protein
MKRVYYGWFVLIVAAAAMVGRRCLTILAAVIGCTAVGALIVSMPSVPSTGPVAVSNAR